MVPVSCAGDSVSFFRPGLRLFDQGFYGRGREVSRAAQAPAKPRTEARPTRHCKAFSGGRGDASPGLKTNAPAGLWGFCFFLPPDKKGMKRRRPPRVEGLFQQPQGGSEFEAHNRNARMETPRCANQTPAVRPPLPFSGSTRFDTLPAIDITRIAQERRGRMGHFGPVRIPQL